MKKYCICVIFSVFFLPVFYSQQGYFQQECNYVIKVKLNDTAHTFSAYEEIQYINNSPQTLDFIYFHLWPNAYKNHNTALAKQLLSEGKTNFYFSTKEERGFIDSLDFKVNGQTVKWEYDKEHIDICKVQLNQPLKAGDSIRISTPFFVKIPDAKFSRLGHDEEAFYITQWYPKPAVYDQNGWHQMPYLDQGEFYSEFGSFDVSITLPKNYILAATGDRIDAEEEENFLNEKVKETMKILDSKIISRIGNSFPESSKEIKTVRFKQYRVHDFAWFADKRLYALHDQIELPTSKRVVDTWVFFTAVNLPYWKDAISYVNESTIFYSHLNGDYPYNHVTALDGTIMAGGGMEYPNITVIGNTHSKFELDVTITHEVGHNWFYGILGSDERTHPFMDEGINSFYEMRYIKAKYPDKKLVELIGRDSSFKLFGLNKVPMWKEKELSYFFSLKKHNDQAIDLPSETFSNFNYGSVVYSKSALVFNYLCEYMGEQKFDEAMRFYFEQFKFKHPSPNDLFTTLSYFSGLNLDAFQKHLIQTTDLIDYKIKTVKHDGNGNFILKLKNKRKAILPFTIDAYKNDKLLGTVWYDGFRKKRKVTFPAADADYFKVDGKDLLSDVNRRNNGIKSKGVFKKTKPLQINFITAIDNPLRTQLNVIPVVGVNMYNGAELGVAFHNYGFFKKKFEWMLAPMFAFNTKNLVGFVDLEYHVFPKKLFQQINLGLKAKSFAYNQFKANNLNANYGTHFNNLIFSYYKVAPYLQFDFKKKARSPIQQSLTLTANLLFVDSLSTTAKSLANLATLGPKITRSSNLVNQIRYDFTNKRSLNPFSFQLNLQQSSTMAKLYGSVNFKWHVSERKTLDIRLFGGTFLMGSTSAKGYYAFRASGYTGAQDYLFEGNYVGRNERLGLGFSQMMDRDAALKVWTPLGYSTEWMTAINLLSPKFGPLKLFVDAAACDGRALNEDPFLWDAGVALILWKDMIEVYVPLLYNQDIKNTLELNNIDFVHRIRFSFNIHKLAPKKIIQDNLF